MTSFVVRHDAAEHRYVLLVDDEPTSFAEYRLVDGERTAVFHHTVTPPAHRNQGYAARVVGGALDDVRRSGRTVIATCWFVDQFITEHPEYEDLLAS